MVKRVSQYASFALLGVLTPTICSSQSSISDDAVRAQVLTIKALPSDIEQGGAAEDLFDMVRGKDLEHVRSRTIVMISMLLDNKSEGVTIWIAATLGEFKGRASFAAPRLIRALEKAECRRVDASSEFTIRTALREIGKDVPKSSCSP